jgi:hypothetical protein
MSDMVYRSDVPAYRRTDWGAIWAGVFSFIAIWSVFGVLGTAIFSSAARPNAAAPSTGMSVGMGIWGVILTIIAMYVAGLETGRLAGVTNKTDAAIHGMVMFGLSIAATLVITILAGTAVFGGPAVPGNANMSSPYLLTLLSDLGWIGFFSLFLGWLAAMGGASQAISTKLRSSDVRSDVREVRRPAA